MKLRLWYIVFNFSFLHRIHSIIRESLFLLPQPLLSWPTPHFAADSYIWQYMQSLNAFIHLAMKKTLSIQNSSLFETFLIYEQTGNLFLKKFTINYSKTEFIPPTFKLLNVVPRLDLPPTAPASLHHPPGKHFHTNYRVSLYHTNV